MYNDSPIQRIYKDWTHVPNPTIRSLAHQLDIHNWCESTCQDEWGMDQWDAWFKDEKDAVMFKLRWSE